MNPRDLEILAKGSGAFVRRYVAEVIAPLQARIAALEAGQKEFGYRGAWRSGETFTRGNFVTDSGSLWHCERENVTSRPGTNGYDWRLCVKRGEHT